MVDALELDKHNSNTMWAGTIAKEMRNVQEAIDPLEDGLSPPNGYQSVQCHIIFDVKMEDFHWKVRLAAGAHMTDMPSTVMHACLVSRETVHIALTMHLMPSK